MSMTVLSMMAQPGPDIYHSAMWRQLVETHLTWIRARRESDVVVIQPHIAYKYEGDLYGALTELRIPQHLHWTVMRVNGLYSPTEFKGDEQVALMVPTRETIQQLASIAATTQKKIT